MTLEMQSGEGVSMHCEMYSLLLHYKTYKTTHIYRLLFLKDNIIHLSQLRPPVALKSCTGATDIKPTADSS